MKRTTIVILVLAVLLLAGGWALFVKRFAAAHAMGRRDPGDKGRLNVLRGAVSVYRLDHKGAYPSDLQALVAAKYLKEIPALAENPHGAGGGPVLLKDPKPRDSGRWGYVSEAKSPADGLVFIDCTHTDAKGSAWSAY